MKKIISILTIFIVLISSNLVIFAQRQEDVKEHVHTHTCEHDADSTIVLANFEKRQEIIRKENIELPVDINLIKASCSHTLSSWKILSQWYEYGNNVLDCYRLYTEEYCYCTKCNQMFLRESSKQLSHSWYGNEYNKKCSICGAERQFAR